MGDRAVIGVRENSSSPTMFMYMHWAGADQEFMLATALNAASSRINMKDGSYASRIIFSHLVGDEWRSETGFGLYVGGTRHGADYTFIYVVDIEAKMVYLCSNNNSDEVIAECDIDEFVLSHGRSLLTTSSL